MRSAVVSYVARGGVRSAIVRSAVTSGPRGRQLGCAGWEGAVARCTDNGFESEEGKVKSEDGIVRKNLEIKSGKGFYDGSLRTVMESDFLTTILGANHRCMFSPIFNDGSGANRR